MLLGTRPGAAVGGAVRDVGRCLCSQEDDRTVAEKTAPGHRCVHAMLAKADAVRRDFDDRIHALVASWRACWSAGQPLRMLGMWDVVAFTSAVYAIDNITQEVGHLGKLVWQIERANCTNQWLWQDAAGDVEAGISFRARRTPRGVNFRGSSGRGGTFRSRVGHGPAGDHTHTGSAALAPPY